MSIRMPEVGSGASLIWYQPALVPVVDRSFKLVEEMENVNPPAPVSAPVAFLLAEKYAHCEPSEPSAIITAYAYVFVAELVVKACGVNVPSPPSVAEV